MRDVARLFLVVLSGFALTRPATARCPPSAAGSFLGSRAWGLSNRKPSLYAGRVDLRSPSSSNDAMAWRLYRHRVDATNPAGMYQAQCERVVHTLLPEPVGKTLLSVAKALKAFFKAL